MNHGSIASNRRDGLTKTTPLVVWRLLDGKPGHENQTRGLVAGLRTHLEVELFNFQVRSRWQGFRDLLLRTFKGAPGGFQRQPDLIIGAGHATHLSLLAARRRYGGHAVVLMAPSLPLWVFALCLIPEHDGAMPSEQVIPTLGVLNTLRPSDHLQADKGLFLIGGPYKHFGWNDETMLEQIRAIIETDHHITWTLTTSRRTPESFLPSLRNERLPNLKIVPVEDTGSQWVPNHLAESGRVWVSGDSVSMVYEALTAGGEVGILSVPKEQSESRVNLGLQFLKNRGHVIPYSNWKLNGWANRVPKRFCEAERCAGEMVRQWFPELL